MGLYPSPAWRIDDSKDTLQSCHLNLFVPEGK